MNKLIFLKIVQVFKKKKKKKTTVQSLNPTVLTTFMNARMITLTIIWVSRSAFCLTETITITMTLKSQKKKMRGSNVFISKPQG